jgi:hypothetical protein
MLLPKLLTLALRVKLMIEVSRGSYLDAAFRNVTEIWLSKPDWIVGTEKAHVKSHLIKLVISSQ